MHITNIAGLQTAYASVNTGTVSLTNALTLGATGSLGNTGGTTASTTNTDFWTSTNGSGISTTNGTSSTPTTGVGVSASNTRTFAESVNLNNRYVVLSFSVVGDTLEIYEESLTGLNLIGNIICDVSVEMDQKETKAFLKTGELFKGRTPVSPDSVNLDFSYIMDPSLSQDLEIPYNATARVRHVANHGRTILESDDVIGYAEGMIPNGPKLKLLTVKSNISKSYVIDDSSGNKKIYDELMIRDNITGKESPVHFNDYFQALNFYKWLVRLQRDGKLKCDPNEGLSINKGDYSIYTSNKLNCLPNFIKGGFVLPEHPNMEQQEPKK